MHKQVKLIISGRVQGVCFRASARDQALQLGVSGWVKNLPDGRVAAFASGDKTTIDTFIDWCRHGPRHALVSQVIIEEIDEPQQPSDFRII